MRRKYPLRRIKTKKSYSTIELAKLFKIHVQTVRDWRKEGMKAIDSGSHRPLFLGIDVKEFLKQRLDAAKIKLKANQFFCLCCKSAVAPQSAETVDRGILVGKQKNSIFLISKCPICNCSIYKFTTKFSQLKSTGNSETSEIKKVIKSAP